MVAAAITTPVTNAAKHENSSRSFSTPVMAASPRRASHVGVSSPEGSSALLYCGGNVTSRSASYSYAEQSWREGRLSPTARKADPLRTTTAWAADQVTA